MAIKRIITFVLGIVLTLAVVNYFGLKETVGVLLTTRLDMLFLAVLLQFFILFLFVLRIKLLAHGKGYLSWKHAARLTFSGMFISMITPLAKLGGEPLKMYMLRSNIGGHKASAAVALESLMEMLSSIFVVFAVALLFFGDVPAHLLSTFVIFLAAISFALGVILKIMFTPHWLHRIIDWFATKIAKMLEAEKKDYATMFSTAFYEMWRSKRTLYGTFSISILIKIVEMVRFWVVFLALGSVVPFKTIVIVWTALLVIAFVPWLPGSLGLLEFSGISAFITFGIGTSVATSGMVLDRLISFWLLLFVGLIALSIAKSRGELPELRRKSKEVRGKSKGDADLTLENKTNV